jgi:UDPglucose 6-dehydrogenase
MAEARKLMPDLDYAKTPYEAAQGVDALVIVTEWDAFRALDLVRMKGLMAQPIVVDLRNIYRLDDMQRLGFAYASVGRPPVGPQ